ncbi:hypothetical protein [Methanolobus sp. WCC5]|uniref:hypothetical protein n=1 Tax=Methanolobus sp. WCC5 TaxID=3125785 RepID=UPI00324E177F
MKTKIIFVAFILMCLCGNALAYAGGDGSAGNPYQITTANDLQNMNNDVTAHYIMINDVDVSHLTFTPIGEITTVGMFEGSFDGMGYTIEGLTIDHMDDHGGLFAYLDMATVQNVTIANATVTVYWDMMFPFVAVLAGEATDSTIKDVTVLNSSIDSDTDRVAGLIGYANNCDISDCLTDVEITSQGSFTGGLIGHLLNSNVERCMALGNVTATGNVQRTGGLIGWSDDSNIINCAALGDVAGYNQVGGLVGKFEGTAYNYAIEKSYSAGSVTGTLQPGGLAGYVYPAISSKVVDSYYDSTRSGQSDTGKGTPKTTAQMMTRSTYTGWNFLDVWFHDVGYPVTASLTPDDFYLYPDGETFNVIAPPLLHEVTFDTYRFGANSYSVNIAKDATFAQSVYSITTNAQALTNLSRTVNLQAGEYHIRIQARDSDGQVFDTTSSTFTVSQTFDLNSTSVAGMVYSLVNGIQTPLPDTLVKIYNETWSDNFVVGSAGYYQFIDLAANNTYNIVATRDGYRDSVVNQFTASNNTTITKNIFMERETAPTYIQPHHVQFIVKALWGTVYEGVTVTVYEGDSATALYTQVTGSDGAVSFELSESVLYRLTAVSSELNINQEMTVPPNKNSYNFYVYRSIWDSFEEEPSISKDIDITVETSTIDNDDAYVNVTYFDAMSETTSLVISVVQINNDGSYKTITSHNAGSNNNVSHSFLVNDYTGEGYLVLFEGTHTSIGEFERTYSIQFPGMKENFGWSTIWIWLAVCGLIFVAGMFGQADVHQGAILVVVAGWIMYGMGMFAGYSVVMGLGVATAIAIAAYMAHRSKEEGA